jgi:hypothetical protein
MLDDLWQLKLNDTPEWRPLKPSGHKPSRRCSHTAVAMGSNIVFHGGAGTDTFAISGVFVDWLLNILMLMQCES